MLEEILGPWDENAPDGTRNPHGFFDYWDLGGRWSGSKLIFRLKKQLGNGLINEFQTKLSDMGVTVSAIQFGKQELTPNWVKPVDDLWKDMTGRDERCPMFAHSDSVIEGDICPAQDVLDFECCRVIIANLPSGYKPGDKMEIVHIQNEAVWNGVNYEKTAWNGKIGDAIENSRLHDVVGNDWISVTIDTHS